MVRVQPSLQLRAVVGVGMTGGHGSSKFCITHHVGFQEVPLLVRKVARDQDDLPELAVKTCTYGQESIKIVASDVAV